MKRAKDGIRYREYREGDLPGIRTLWRDDAQWGDITPEMWRQWYVDIPNGPALVVVGEAPDGRIVAQAAMTPAELLVDGRIHRAVHLSAPIVTRRAQSFLSPSLNHPAFRLLVACNRRASRRGIAVIYGMPRVAWLAALRFAPLLGVPRFPGITMKCYEKAVSSSPAAHETRVDVKVIDRFDDEYDELWHAAVRNLPIACSVVRSSAYLNFRNGGHRCLSFRDRATGQLVGYAAIRDDGLVTDALPREATWMTDILASCLDYLAREDVSPRVDVLKVMQTPRTTDALLQLGFRATRFQFGFTCRAVDESLADAVHPSHWYLTPNG